MSHRSVIAVISTPLACLAMLNLWIFARFTVDDAFITWRYGRNLIEHGIWGYNASGFDLTQAYTNPIYAVLSIIPASMGLDVVLFFKFISIVVGGLLVWALLAVSGDRARMVILLLVAAAVPATTAHLFSGLETVAYVGALGLYFVALDRERWQQALALVILLVLTRPEAWLLFGLHPLALIMAHHSNQSKIAPRKWEIIFQIGVLAGVAAIYFGFHIWYFGNALPNTFFVKSGEWSWSRAAGIVPFALPAVGVLVMGPHRTGLIMTLYFGAVAYSYASSDLLMNYMQRFAFQIAMPIALYLAWRVSKERIGGPSNWSVAAVAAFLLAFGIHTRGLPEHFGIANYYPRLLDSHVLLGRALNTLGHEGRISGVALGDAGAPAFHADLRALDTIGLGSQRVARDGLTIDVVRAYAPDVVAFFATAEGIRDLPERHDALWGYVAETGMQERCEIFWARQYTLRLYSRVPHPDLTEACVTSLERNRVNELAYALNQLIQPPWHYWHE